MGQPSCSAFVCLLLFKKIYSWSHSWHVFSPIGILESPGILSGQDQSSAGLPGRVRSQRKKKVLTFYPPHNLKFDKITA